MFSGYTKNHLFIIYSFFALLLFSITSFAEFNSFNIKKAETLDLHEQYSTNNEKRIFFEAFDKHFTLNIHENKDISKNLSSREDLGSDMFYKGYVNGESSSWVRLSKVNDLWRGAVFDGEELYLIDSTDMVIEELDNSAFAKVALFNPEHLVVKASDIEQLDDLGLGHQHVLIDNPYQILKADLTKGLDYTDLPIALGATNRQLNMTIIADAEFASRVGGDVVSSVMSIVNIIDGIFDSQVNVSLAVEEVIVLSSNSPLVSTDALDLLNELQEYVDDNIVNPGIVHLFTGKEMDSNTVGIAYLDAICSQSYGIGLSETYRSTGALIAAHEIGHNFGAPHDNQSGSACSNTANSFLMNPFINGSDEFSNCSLNRIEDTIANQGNCLVSVDPESTPSPIPTEVPEPTPEPTPAFLAINGELRQLISYGGGQDVEGEMSVQDEGQTLELRGNNWKAVSFDYVVTPSTVIEFDLQSNSEGEIIAIGFDTDTQASTEFGFRLYGTQLTGTNTISDFDSYEDSAPAIVRFTIPVGEYYSGAQNYIFFQNDDDVNANSHSRFSNIIVYEGNGSSTGSEIENAPPTNSVPSPTPTSTPGSNQSPIDISNNSNNLVPGSSSGGGGSANKYLLLLMSLIGLRLKFMNRK